MTRFTIKVNITSIASTA